MHTFIEFEVQSQHLEKAKELIQVFIEQIKLNEPDTIYYQSFQNSNQSTKFIHTMSFKNDKARDLHRNSWYCMEFVEALYPICASTPVPQNYELIHSKAPMGS